MSRKSEQKDWEIADFLKPEKFCSEARYDIQKNPSSEAQNQKSQENLFEHGD
ncbi:hypothetical protein LBWT_54300 [Leptolyngbya boryana IAM M-101]|nr:hypothetical protein LBWT_54300 [Leptolyngbya boryana IAM M-101]BAS65807.1 hypothetical protein LBDG_54300 [Leptolyngbya boryana dg5]